MTGVRQAILATVTFLSVAVAMEVFGHRVAIAQNVQSVCAGTAPHGWVVTNDAWVPTRCGNATETRASNGFEYNVWSIENLSSVPVGGTLSICSGYIRLPSNWVTISTTWIPTRCGHPTSIIHNVATIKRVS